MKRWTGSRGILNLLIDNEHDAHLNPRWKPTEELPGSPAKLKLLTKRVLCGLPLFHPDDRGTRDLRWHHDIDGGE